MESLHGRTQPRQISERSRSRLTRHGTRDDTRHKSSDITAGCELASMHCGTRSQLHGAAQWVGYDAAQSLTPRSDHLRSTTAQSAHRRDPAASSRPKCEEHSGHRSRGSTSGWSPDRRGCPGIVKVVDLRGGDVPPSRSSVEVDHLGRVVRARRVPALTSLRNTSSCSDEHGFLAAAYT